MFSPQLSVPHQKRWCNQTSALNAPSFCWTSWNVILALLLSMLPKSSANVRHLYSHKAVYVYSPLISFYLDLFLTCMTFAFFLTMHFLSSPQRKSSFYTVMLKHTPLTTNIKLLIFLNHNDVIFAPTFTHKKSYKSNFNTQSFASCSPFQILQVWANCYSAATVFWLSVCSGEGLHCWIGA